MPQRIPAEARAWLAVALWSLSIFGAVPLARAIQAFVDAHFGRALFGWTVIAAVAAGALAAGASVARRRRSLRELAPHLAWLAAVAAVFTAYTVALWRNPEEALHFVQYGVLGILLHLALRHRLRDAGIYVAAAALGAVVGILDETLQWLVPQRFWALRDVWLNFFACALVQVGIALGIRPEGIRGAPGPESARWIARSLALALLLLGASLLNTPDRIRTYAHHLPGADVMLEYGHRHDDPEIGRWRSRFTPEELRRIDAERADEAAAILDRHPDDEAYESFLELYTPVTDPFLHEARVHLFRRDRHLALAAEKREGSRGQRERLTVAWREQLILERHFGETLRRSRFALGPEARAHLAAAQLPELAYESAVSRELVTAVGEGSVLLALALGLLLLFSVDRRYGASEGTA
jgi:hypothetical protein